MLVLTHGRAHEDAQCAVLGSHVPPFLVVVALLLLPLHLPPLRLTLRLLIGHVLVQ